MQIPSLFRLALLLAAAPIALLALPSVDGKIETTARQSYNFRVVLDNQVRIRVNQGQATIYGSVPDAESRVLAQDTVENIPLVTSVRNEITVESRYTVRSDSWMALKIRARLLVMANVSATTTYVSVQDGVATLGGSARSEAQKELTALYAGEIDSVKSVKNNIVVGIVPADRDAIDDASVTAQVKFALLRHRATSALKTTVTTTDGVVRVTGEAANAAEKTLVTKLVQDVRGAATVTNDMTIKG